MADNLLASLSGGDAVHTCSLATVTSNCVIIRTASARSHAILSLARISGTTTVRTTYPAFLAIASGFFLIAAAAYFSKDGGSAHIPLSALGGASVIAYFVSRREAVIFWSGREPVETIRGGLREATNLVRAVERAQSSLREDALAATAAIAS